MIKTYLLFLLIICPYTYSQNISFITFGDWGREGKYLQKETADAMAKFAEEQKTDFILVLGDNFYPTGVRSVNDPHWKVSFEDVYNAPSLQIPWYITIGNHDYGGNVQAQIDYSTISSRWIIPSRYYSFEKNIDDNTKILFVVIDSNPFIKSYLTSNKDNEELDTNSVFELKKQNTALQLKWLDSVLSSSNAKWKIVAGHHPVYSGGEHGDTPELIELVNPILVKNNVNMYLCGHDHDMQHIVRTESNVNYFVSGTGSKLRNTGNTEFTKFSASENGFLNIKAGKDFLKSNFIGLNGNVLYSVDIK